MEMDQFMTTDLTLTLPVGWNVSCDNDGSVTQTVTLFDYSFQVNPRTVLEREKMSSVKIISDIYLHFQYIYPTFSLYCKLIVHTESARFVLSNNIKMNINSDSSII